MREQINNYAPALTLDPEIVPLRDQDRALMEDIAETLASHQTLRGLSLPFVVSGTVVHLRGQVPSEQVRRLVRRVIARIRGIGAVWDTLLVEGEPLPRVIDIGCGTHKQIPWAVGVDRHAYDGVDIVTDLETRLPFSDDELDHVYAVHVLEHVHDLVHLMNEIHRCLKPGGVLHCMVPSYRAETAIADPTHLRQFNPKTFLFFCRAGTGIQPFRPLIVYSDEINILADLAPVKEPETPASVLELARHFG